MGIPIPEFKILLYGPSFHSAGTRARARFEGNALAISSRYGFFLVPPERITLRTGGYDGRQWLIDWTERDATYSAMLQSAEALEAFIQLAPANLARQLGQSRKRQTNAGRHVRTVPTLFALIALLLLGLGLLWANADRLGKWAVSHISTEQEQRLGELAHAQLLPSLKLMRHGLALAAVESIGKRLAGEFNFTYHFHVAVDPEINAYALPGGSIVVNTGLLKEAASAAELAGVLAHLISHVEQRHTLRTLMHAQGWRATLGAITGDFSGAGWSNMAAHLSSLSYSREQENEADKVGLEMLRRAGITPHDMESFLLRMAERHAKLPPLLSSHPAGKERLTNLRAAIARQPTDDLYPIGIDWEHLQTEL